MQHIFLQTYKPADIYETYATVKSGFWAHKEWHKDAVLYWELTENNWKQECCNYLLKCQP